MDFIFHNKSVEESSIDGSEFSTSTYSTPGAIFFFGGWERHLSVLATWIENKYQVFDFISTIWPNGINRYNLILRKKIEKKYFENLVLQRDSNPRPSVRQTSVLPWSYHNSTQTAAII